MLKIFQGCIEKKVEEISAPGPQAGPPYDVYKWRLQKPPIKWPYDHMGFTGVFLNKPSNKWSRFTVLGGSSPPAIRGVISPPTGDELPAPPG